MAKILVVDDSTYARRVHRGFLEAGGHEVLEASSGLAALESFGLEHPDLVLLDLSMEDVAGVDVLRQMKEMNAGARVVVVSADVQRTTSDRVKEAGASRFLGKPVRREDLLATVDSVLSEAR